MILNLKQLKTYEAILQYILDGEILEWVKMFTFSWATIEKENIKTIENKIRIEYQLFELIKITKL